jgi:tRNA threonylcarbamoyladenosine biosynthesis protein TsaB
MITLACETSTLLGSVAVLKDQTVLAYKDSYRQGSHSDVLNVFIESVLDEAKLKLSDVDLFASGIGPGSFTGIRISLNAIKTFAFCYGKPCIGIDSLSNLAHQCAAEPSLQQLPIVAMINAYKNMVYIGTYKKQGASLITVKEPSVVRVQNLDAYLESDSYVVGDGFLAYKDYFAQHLKTKLLRPNPVSDEPNAKFLAKLAVQAGPKATLPWNELIPVYLRESEAEENAKGIKYQPLF